jgi:hypothetical protein
MLGSTRTYQPRSRVGVVLGYESEPGGRFQGVHIIADEGEWIAIMAGKDLPTVSTRDLRETCPAVFPFAAAKERLKNRASEEAVKKPAKETMEKELPSNKEEPPPNEEEPPPDKGCSTEDEQTPNEEIHAEEDRSPKDTEPNEKAPAEAEAADEVKEDKVEIPVAPATKRTPERAQQWDSNMPDGISSESWRWMSASRKRLEVSIAGAQARKGLIANEQNDNDVDDQARPHTTNALPSISSASPSHSPFSLPSGGSSSSSRGGGGGGSRRRIGSEGEGVVSLPVRSREESQVAVNARSLAQAVKCSWSSSSKSSSSKQGSMHSGVKSKALAKVNTK